ncbi:unnamed protein product [Protopolystoma xenopodis]|uniref:Uncharacterized protein n=1 Tax=Protopolystoma xenopodis TaxID=117903 RepID=A0A448WWA2_9PLAT|nr:unnamed protein product [Protopolystoma xenopodis]
MGIFWFLSPSFTRAVFTRFFFNFPTSCFWYFGNWNSPSKHVYTCTVQPILALDIGPFFVFSKLFSPFSAQSGSCYSHCQRWATFAGTSIFRSCRGNCQSGRALPSVFDSYCFFSQTFYGPR